MYQDLGISHSKNEYTKQKMCPFKIKAMKGTFKVLTFGKPKHENSMRSVFPPFLLKKI